MIQRPVFIITMLALLFWPIASRASTLVLEGTIEGEVEITHERTFTMPKGGLEHLSFRYANPAEGKSASVAQGLSSRKVEYLPKPEEASTARDAFGNAFTTARWDRPQKEIKIREVYRVESAIRLKGLKSSAPFPIKPQSVPESERRFLAPTPLVQSDDAKARELSGRLTAGASTEQAAVMAILNWTADNIKYRSPVEAYDALWTIQKGHGNCQNFSHLALALLRAAGIPARMVGGVALGKPWKVPMKQGSLVQTTGQGGHAWIEVWYQDLGWVPYDVQQSHLFVGPRHIKQTVGLDAMDINDSWRASPVLPAYREEISAEYGKDVVALSLKETNPAPLSYILAPSMIQGGAAVPPPVETAVKAPSRIAEFGNLQFPTLVEVYSRVDGTEGRKTFDRETAEYVTGPTAYAQAFTVERPLRLSTVSLAMHKFGGRAGSLWLDIVKDEKGKPGLEGARSLPLHLDRIRFHPGYRWFDFTFPGKDDERPLLAPGRYWIVLRHSKDAIVNWFYTPGNAVGGPDDARSTGKGIDWPEVMNYDFNFKVSGVYAD